MSYPVTDKDVFLNYYYTDDTGFRGFLNQNGINHENFWSYTPAERQGLLKSYFNLQSTPNTTQTSNTMTSAVTSNTITSNTNGITSAGSTAPAKLDALTQSRINLNKEYAGLLKAQKQNIKFGNYMAIANLGLGVLGLLDARKFNRKQLDIAERNTALSEKKYNDLQKWRREYGKAWA